MSKDWETRWANEPKAAEPPAAEQAASSTPRLPASATDTIVFPVISTAVNRLAEYEQIEDVATTIMGQVRRALHCKTKRPVAIKHLPKQVASERERARLEYEGEIIAKLKHEHIVTLYDCFEYNGSPLLVLEWVDGGTLEDLVKTRGPLPWKEALQHLIVLAEAMQYAHSERVIHRDLKPNNVLVTSGGKLKITDFGLGMVQGNTLNSLLPAGAGTVAFMAPEQNHSPAKVNHLADQFALGAIGYFLVTGKTIRSTDDNVTRDVTTLPPMELRWPAKLPEDFQAILLRCLQVEPGQRYKSTADLLADLHRLQEGKPVAARPAGLVRRGWMLVKRNPLVSSLVTLVVAILAVSAVSLWLLYLQNRREKENAIEILNQAITMLREFEILSVSHTGGLSQTKWLQLQIQLHVLNQNLIFLNRPGSVDRENVLKAVINAGATLWDLGEHQRARNLLMLTQVLVEDTARLSPEMLNRLIYYQALCHEETGFQEIGLQQAMTHQADLIRKNEDAAADEMLIQEYLQTVCARGQFYVRQDRDDQAVRVYHAAKQLLQGITYQSPKTHLLFAQIHVQGAQALLSFMDSHSLVSWFKEGDDFFAQHKRYESSLIGFAALAAEWDLCHARYLSLRASPQALTTLKDLEFILRQTRYVDLTYPQREEFLAEAYLLHANILLRTHGLGDQADAFLKQYDQVVRQLPEATQPRWHARLLLTQLECDALQSQPARALERLQRFPDPHKLPSEAKATIMLLLSKMVDQTAPQIQEALHRQCQALCQTLPAQLKGTDVLPALAIPTLYRTRWQWSLTVDRHDASEEATLARYWQSLQQSQPAELLVELENDRLLTIFKLVNALEQHAVLSVDQRRLAFNREDAVAYSLYQQLCRQSGKTPYLPLPPP